MNKDICEALEKSQADILARISQTIEMSSQFKMSSLKREFLEVAEESHTSQLAEIKKMKFSDHEPRSFKKKGHEQQYQEAKAAVSTGKPLQCHQKLDEGIELIEQRQKLILLADTSECGWKTVNEYQENELADDEADAKRIKKAEKEAQRKLNEFRSKAAKSKTFTMSKGNSQSPYWQSGYGLPRYRGTVHYNPNIPLNTEARPFRRSGTCFACGKPGHWRSECPLLMTPTMSQQLWHQSPSQLGAKAYPKLSMQIEECVSCTNVAQADLLPESEVDLFLLGVYNEHVGEYITPIGHNLNVEHKELVVTLGRLKDSIEFWELLCPSKFIKFGYKLPLITLPEHKVFKNNRSAFNNAEFVSAAVEALLAAGSFSKVSFIPSVVNPLSVSITDKGKERLILDLRHVNLHLFKFKFKLEDVDTFTQLVESHDFLFSFDIKSAYHHIEILEDHRLFLGFSWVVMWSCDLTHRWSCDLTHRWSN
jgi:hypothetical protein